MRRDSNPQPLEHESSPITTRPGLRPGNGFSFLCVNPNETSLMECKNLLLYVLILESTVKQ